MRDFALETLVDDAAVLVVDETSFLQQGKASSFCSAPTAPARARSLIACRVSQRPNRVISARGETKCMDLPGARSPNASPMTTGRTGAFAFVVQQIVLMGGTAHIDGVGSPSAQDREVTRRAMIDMIVDDLRTKPFTPTSGSERKLALIARARAGHPNHNSRARSRRSRSNRRSDRTERRQDRLPPRNFIKRR